MRSMFFWVMLCGVMGSVLSGCGGAGEEIVTFQSTSYDPEQPYPLQSALKALDARSESRAFTLEGFYNGQPAQGQGTLVESAPIEAQFGNTKAMAKTHQLTGTMTVAGQNQALDARITHYFDLQYSPIGVQTQEDFTVIDNVVIPATVKVGETGMLYTAETYRSESRKERTGYVIATYSVVGGRGQSPRLTVQQSYLGLDHAPTGTLSTDFRWSSEGNLVKQAETWQMGPHRLVRIFK